MTRRELLGLGAGTAAMLLAGCGRRVERFRYRVTAEIATRSGLRTGASVQELEHSGKIGWLPGGDSYRTQIHGEAVAIDLPGDTLFLLMARDSDRLIELALLFGTSSVPLDPAVVKDWPWSRVELLHSLEKENAQLILEPAKLPPFGRNAIRWIRFGDPDEPTSYELVETDQIESRFGAGVRLERIVLDFVNDEPTTGIDRRLKWVNDVAGYEKRAAERGATSFPRELYDLKN